MPISEIISKKLSEAIRRELSQEDRIEVATKMNGSINTINAILFRTRSLCSSYLPHFKELTKKALKNNAENRKILIELQELLDKNYEHNSNKQH